MPRPANRPAPTADDLRRATTVSVEGAGAFLGMSASAAYRAADRGDLPVLVVNNRRRVPTPRLLAMVGLSYEAPSG